MECEKAREQEREREPERERSFSHEKKQHRLTTFFAAEFDRKINISDQIDEFGDRIR